MRKTKCLPESMVPPLQRKQIWKLTSPRIEEAKKRDHRKLGKQLGLFMMRDEGPGFPFFLPNGMILKNTLLDYWREIHRKAGYVEISTPIMLSRHLWETSGHWDHYKENMYTTVIDDDRFRNQADELSGWNPCISVRAAFLP